MSKKRKNKKLTPLADSLTAVYGAKEWGTQWHLFTLVHNWPKIAGSQFADRSMPARFQRDTLWVYVQDSVWMQQIQLCKMELLDKINKFLQKKQVVEDIRWELLPPWMRQEPVEEYVPPPINVDPAAERSFRQMAEIIEDKATREAFCNLWLHLESIKNAKE